MIHALKITPQFFEDVTSCKKLFEVRKNDRDFKQCDYIALNEYNPEKIKYTPVPNGYSGRSALFQITYILDNPEFCKEGYVILGLTPCMVSTAEDVDVQKLYGQAREVTE